MKKTKLYHCLLIIMILVLLMPLKVLAYDPEGPNGLGEKSASNQNGDTIICETVYYGDPMKPKSDNPYRAEINIKLLKDDLLLHEFSVRGDTHLSVLADVAINDQGQYVIVGESNRQYDINNGFMLIGDMTGNYKFISYNEQGYDYLNLVEIMDEGFIAVGKTMTKDVTEGKLTIIYGEFDGTYEIEHVAIDNGQGGYPYTLTMKDDGTYYIHGHSDMGLFELKGKGQNYDYRIVRNADEFETETQEDIFVNFGIYDVTIIDNNEVLSVKERRAGDYELPLPENTDNFLGWRIESISETYEIEYHAPELGVEFVIPVININGTTSIIYLREASNTNMFLYIGAGIAVIAGLTIILRMNIRKRSSIEE